ncbi:uncharacterized protein LOC143174241 [Nomia melanderi]|uniref:uncharacterized protein LOC143174241 n=1 Tax=Nomia melanderi TaxID=2448451 RepID=UPI003FCD9F83
MQINNLQHAVIYTDSMGTINAITNISAKAKHEIIQAIQEICTDLSHSNNHIILTWVPSHQGISGNEKADSMAKKATTDPETEIKKQIPFKDLLKSIYVTEEEEWNRIWTTSNRTKIHSTLNLNRKNRSILSRLRIGYAIITHEHLLKRTESTFCSTYYLRITTHLLYKCRRYQTEKLKYTLDPVTALTSEDHIRNTVNYPKETQLYNKI